MRLSSAIAALGLAAWSMMANAQSLNTTDIVELYGQADQAWGAEVSTEGDYVAIGCAPLGPPAVCIYSLTEGGQPKLFQIPDNARLTDFFWISPKHMLIRVNLFDTIQTSSGLQDYRFDRMISFNVETGNSEILFNKEARNTTQGDLMVAALPEDEDKILMMLWYERSTWKVDLNKGSARHEETYGNQSQATRNSRLNATTELDDIYFYPNGDVAATVVWDNRTGKYTLKDGRRKTLIESSGHDRYPYSIVGFSPDGEALLAWADTNDDYGLKQISLEDGAISAVEIDGQTLGNVSPIKDETNDRMVGIAYADDLPRQLFIDPVFKSWHEELKLVFPDQNVLITSWTSDKTMMTIAVQSEGKPSAYYLFETEGPNVSPLAEAAPQLSQTMLGTVEPVQYTASDGLEIPGYLTLPPGKTREDGPFPLVLMPHGGPEARDLASFEWWAQSYAAAGYAVLQPNFRGSYGFGQSFRNAGFGEFGGKMITDSLEGAQWAVEQGIAREGGYCIVGASYGGYAALQGAILGGEEVACAISVNGVSDPLSLIRNAPTGSDYFSYWEEYMGVTRFSSDDDAQAITPRDRAAEIRSPVLLIHGREDTTVDYVQSSALARVMDGRSDFKLVSMEGEDHYLGSRDARQTVLSESLDWLTRYLPLQ
ncbi:MAG: hypothetical protein CMK09_17915 [Ponticaulis sp.]|nr:hypothetical protein [Ponticaulis sp.]|tara:strand:- start:6215 stop:8173 length:1959 start_codon:yes stop_codon:yes gene_type:complete